MGLKPADSQADIDSSCLREEDAPSLDLGGLRSGGDSSEGWGIPKVFRQLLPSLKRSVSP